MAKQRDGDRTSSNLPKEKDAPTVADIALAFQQVHDARAVRDGSREAPRAPIHRHRERRSTCRNVIKLRGAAMKGWHRQWHPRVRDRS